MQYPIIDNLIYAYQRNGWTGLNIIEGKNLLHTINGTYPLSGGIVLNIENETITINGTGTSYSTYNIYLGSPVEPNTRMILSGSKTGTGPVHFRLRDTPAGKSKEISLNGGSIQTPYTVNILQLALNPTSYDASIIQLQLEKGTEATPYEPYEPPTTDIANRLKLPLPHYFPHPVIDALQRAAAGTQTADDTEILRHYLTPLGIGGI